MRRLDACSQAWLALSAAAAVLLAAHAKEVGAQAMRDPTVPPAAARAPAATPDAPGGVAAPPAAPKHLVRIDGVPYVVEGTRRRGVGDLLGSARIERITETDVWVSEGGSVTRMPLHGNVVKQIAVESPATASDSRPARKSCKNPNHRCSPSSKRGESP